MLIRLLFTYMFNHRYRYGFILLLALYSYTNALFSEAFIYYKLNVEAFYLVSIFILICLCVWEGNRYLDHFINKRFKLQAVKIHPLFIHFGFSQVTTILSAIISFSIVRLWVGEEPSSGQFIAFKLTILFAMRVNLFMHCINAIIFYIRQYQQKALESETLRRVNAQAELAEIKNSINPHFLFNNLNVLSSLVMQHSQDANRFIEAFSSVYRYILNSRYKELVSVQDELELLEPYCFLLQTRFGESLHINIDIPPHVRSWCLVPVTLQLLVENGIKHNILSKQTPLVIDIKYIDNYALMVSNNLQLKNMKESSTHFGLESIRKRYQLITGKDIEQSISGNNFIVVIPLIKIEGV